MISSISGYDEVAYAALVRRVGAMSQLYSDNGAPFIHSRFAERLFVFITGGRDLARKDNSFDVIVNGSIGVGVKTFVRSSKAPGSRSEKVAEFAKDASAGHFKNRSKEEIAVLAARLRNDRVVSNANVFSIDLSSSYYHCLVRVPGGAFVHEEPYGLINLDNLKPTNSRGVEIPNFALDGAGHVHFTDGLHKYIYNTSKNVLLRQFDTRVYFNSRFIDIPVEADILQRLAAEEALIRDIAEKNPTALEVPSSEVIPEPVIGKDAVVLPLYSVKDRMVAVKSGLNQWLANGRSREFGEAYIPIPTWIHDKYKFFPPRDVKFKLRLPNGDIISAKVCQDKGKALMSDPNKLLCDWLFKMIDGNEGEIQQRLKDKRPYTYKDLARVGVDSVLVSKSRTDDADFDLSPLPTGAFAEFAGIEPIAVEL